MQKISSGDQIFRRFLADRPCSERIVELALSWAGHACLMVISKLSMGVTGPAVQDSWGRGDGGVDAVDAVLGHGEAEEAVSVLLGVVGECPAGERVGPGHGRRGATDFGEGVEVRVAAGARDDVGERFAVVEWPLEALVVVDVPGEDEVGDAAGVGECGPLLGRAQRSRPQEANMTTIDTPAGDRPPLSLERWSKERGYFPRSVLTSDLLNTERTRCA